MAGPETPFTQVERHVRESEARVARQLALVEKLNASGRYDEADSARDLLAVLADSLDLAHQHLHRLIIEERQ